MTRGGGMPGRSAGMMASLNRGNAPQQGSTQAAAAADRQMPEMNEPVDESALRRTWKQYIQIIPEEKLLQTAIQNSEVKLVEDTRIDVTVGSEEQMQRIIEGKAALLNYLRQQLRNSLLNLSFTVNAVAVPKAPLTPRERMAEMRQEHPELIEELVNTFGLELS